MPALVERLRERIDTARARRIVRRRMRGPLVLPERIRSGGSRIAAVAIFKNEARDIAEWIDFHRAVGFDRFILYDNGSEDGTAEVASRVGNGEVSLTDWRHFNSGLSTQILAYNHAAANHGHDCAWMAFIDIDEFLFPIEDRPIGDVLRDYADVPGIAVPWHMYGTGGHATPPEAGVLAGFQRRAPFPPTGNGMGWLLNYKTIFQPGRLLRAHTHIPLMRDEPEYFRNERKDRIPITRKHDPGLARSEVFRLNHYYTKDAASFRRKIDKGRSTGANGQRRQYEKLLGRAAILENADIHDPIAERKRARQRRGGG